MPVYLDGAVNPMGSVAYGDQMNFINGGTAHDYKLAPLQRMYVSVIC